MTKKNLPKVVGFNYAKIDAKYQNRVEGHAKAISTLLERTASHLVEIGQRLIEVKEALPDGLFIGWIYAEFQWSRSTALRFMRIARSFGDLDCIEHFQPAALDYLSKGKIPDTAVREAVQAARSGEVVSKNRACQIVSQHTARATRQPVVPDNVLERVDRFVRTNTQDMNTGQMGLFADALERHAGKLRERAGNGRKNRKPRLAQTV